MQAPHAIVCLKQLPLQLSQLTSVSQMRQRVCSMAHRSQAYVPVDHSLATAACTRID